MNAKANNNSIFLHTFIVGLFLMDETLLPVFHPAGIPIKLSYVLLLFALVFHIFSIRVNKDLNFGMAKRSDARNILLLILVLVLLSCLGELTMAVFANISNSQPFKDALLNYVFMMAAFILGYAVYAYDKKVLLYVLYLYCLINICLLMFYDYLPGFITSMYGEYYVTGIRIRGTGGNANTTMLVMNMLLVSVVALFKLGKLKISGIHVWLVLIVPILTNVFVSSRGEFVHTVLLELIYLYFLVKSEKDKSKTIGRIIIIVVLLVGAYFFVFGYLYETNLNVRYGIDRLATIGEVTETGEFSTGEADTLLRPFFRADVFWARFKHSPIWGAGSSYGSTADFIKSANGYHNDWFRVLASTGILGFLCWIMLIKKAVKRTGIMIVLPFVLASLTNTFLQSTHALNVCFFLLGTVFHLTELSEDTKMKLQG